MNLLDFVSTKHDQHAHDRRSSRRNYIKASYSSFDIMCVKWDALGRDMCAIVRCGV